MHPLQVGRQQTHDYTIALTWALYMEIRCRPTLATDFFIYNVQPVYMEALNIPIVLVKRYKASKAEKELLAFAIGIKCLYSNSVLTNVTPYKVMRLFHVSHDKAKHLIDGARNDSSLFTVTGNNLLVKTFKSKEIKKSRGRNPYKYTSDYCYKLNKKDYSIRVLVRELNRIMLLCAVNSIDRDNFPLRSGKPQNKKRCALTKDLTLHKLGNISGVSKSTAHRLMNDMYQNGIITKTSARGEMVIHSVNAVTVEEWRKRTGRKHFIYNPKDGSGWIVTPCSYSICDRGTTERYKHVIYNYKKRLQASNRRISKSATYANPFDNPVNAAYL